MRLIAWNQTSDLVLRAQQFNPAVLPYITHIHTLRLWSDFGLCDTYSGISYDRPRERSTRQCKTFRCCALGKIDSGGEAARHIHRLLRDQREATSSPLRRKFGRGNDAWASWWDRSESGERGRIGRGGWREKEEEENVRMARLTPSLGEETAEHPHRCGSACGVMLTTAGRSTFHTVLCWAVCSVCYFLLPTARFLEWMLFPRVTWLFGVRSAHFSHDHSP